MKVIVAGGTRGIGRAIADAFIDAGHSTCIIGRNAPLDNPGHLYVAADFSKGGQVADAIAAAADLLSGCDVLIHSVGTNIRKAAIDYSCAEFDHILGVNLIYACYFQSGSIDEFIDGIVHRLPPDRMEIDMLRISGPDFEDMDNRIIALNLVRRGITNATMFDLAKNVMQPSTALYKKNILLMRGRFRPVTKVHIDMIERARAAFAKEKRVKPEQLEVVFELTLKDLTADGKISDKDFLDRAELLGSLGYTVMVSNYLKHYKMLEYLSSIARGNLVGVIMGIYNLHIIFDEKYYDNLPGGLLEAFGRGFGHNVKLYIYPALNMEDGSLYHLGNIKLPENLMGLLNYMQANDKITALQEYDPSLLHILSDDVLSKIKANAQSWEDDVPYEVVKAIKFFELFGYQQKVEKN